MNIRSCKANPLSLNPVYITMETTAKKSKKKLTTEDSETGLDDAYIRYVLEHGKKPPSVFKFCTELGVPENKFYDQFGSFEGLERHIWKRFIHTTIQRLKADKSFTAFSSREKILAFYYTLFEELKLNRSFILVQLDNYKKLEIIPGFLRDFKISYEIFLEGVLEAGKTDGEVAKRPYLDKRYPQIFWFHMAFLLIFWRDDESAGFEKTDAAIEKSVNLAFDLIGKGAIDSMFDFAKFLYQTKVK
jgi:hypothetical protein